MSDTLYTLARKMEARQSNRNSRGAPSDGYRDRYRRYLTPANRVATVGEGGDSYLPIQRNRSLSHLVMTHWMGSALG